MTFQINSFKKVLPNKTVSYYIERCTLIIENIVRSLLSDKGRFKFAERALTWLQMYSGNIVIVSNQNLH